MHEIDYRKTRPLGQRHLGPVSSAAPEKTATAAPRARPASGLPPLVLHDATRALYPRYGQEAIERAELTPPRIHAGDIKLIFSLVAVGAVGVLIAMTGHAWGLLLLLIPTGVFAASKRTRPPSSPWR